MALKDLNTQRLFRGEQFGMALLPAITTVTRFRGNAPVKFLHERCKSILYTNPWLAGTLKSDESAVVLLLHPDTEFPIHTHFEICDNVDIGDEDNYADMVGKLTHLGVKRGIECIDTNQVLFKITVVVDRVGGGYHLIVSMSHVLGDGHTFYSIYGMLSATASVKPLVFDRSFDFHKQLYLKVGSNSSKWANHALIPHCLRFTANWCSNLTPHLLQINDSWLQSEKRRFQSSKEKTKEDTVNVNTSYISSNDILTSWYLKLCGAPMGAVVVNFRGRVSAVSDQHAGNYQSLITLNEPSDFAQPECIRAAVQQYRCNSCTAPPSYLWNWRQYFGIALCTNWASMYQHLTLYEDTVTTITSTDPTESADSAERGQRLCEHVVHLPLMSVAELSCWPEVMVLFRLDEARLGAIIGSRSIRNMSDTLTEATVLNRIPK